MYPKVQTFISLYSSWQLAHAALWASLQLNRRDDKALVFNAKKNKLKKCCHQSSSSGSQEVQQSIVDVIRIEVGRGHLTGFQYNLQLTGNESVGLCVHGNVRFMSTQCAWIFAPGNNKNWGMNISHSGYKALKLYSLHLPLFCCAFARAK